MIISPPFLPTGQTQTSDEAWVNANMPDAPPQNTPGPAGSYPLGYNLAWHNGMHIDAQALARFNNGQVPPARAVADGKVIFAQPPSAMSSNPKHPQNYNPWDDSETPTPRWTDNGIVVIEHTTAIGAHGNSPTELGNTPTVLVYYSVYMHLAALGQTTATGKGAGAHPWQAGDAIWRKDEVGTPGQIYGASGQIHFEICMNEENVKVLLGRKPAWIEPGAIPAPTQDGRTDSVYGSTYFYVDDQTPASITQPTVHTRQRSNTVVGSKLWVRMTYHKGGCRYDTFDAQGRLLGGRDDTDIALEYNLQGLAESCHKSLSGPDRAASSPSGWYELLRFGRNIGYGANAADKDRLPANASHWRCIKSASGHDLWVDLNAEQVRKFSDADFLPAMGWNCIVDDSNERDQRCDSNALKNLISDTSLGNAHRLEPRELEKRLSDPQIRKILSKILTDFPCEWDRSTASERYAFIREAEPFRKSATAWPRLQAHMESMTFEQLPTNLLKATWHIHPRQFVSHLRKCVWLSAHEFAQCIPRKSLAGPVSWNTAIARAERYSVDYNRFIRKFSGNSIQRYLHNIAQSLTETGLFRTLTEDGRGVGKAYGAHYGRGFHQLTWAGNFKSFGEFSGLADHHGQYTDGRITTTSVHPIDSGTGTMKWAPRYDPAVVELSMPLGAPPAATTGSASTSNAQQISIDYATLG